MWYGSDEDDDKCKVIDNYDIGNLIMCDDDDDDDENKKGKCLPLVLELVDPSWSLLPPLISNVFSIWFIIAWKSFFNSPLY